jgi:hypothetical protein
VSLAGTLASFKGSNNMMTGYATSNDTGLASIDVSQSVILRFAINSTDFGAGSINSSGGYTSCNLMINGSRTIYQYGCNGFNENNTGGNDAFILENAGTSYLNVTINITGNASTFIGGNKSVSSMRYAVSLNESNSCPGTLYDTAWTEVTVPNASKVICSNMSWQGDRNTIRIGLNITIPADAFSGARSITLIAQGTSS